MNDKGKTFFDLSRKERIFLRSLTSTRLETQTRSLIEVAPVDGRSRVDEEFFCKISSEKIIGIEISRINIV